MARRGLQRGDSRRGEVHSTYFDSESPSDETAEEAMGEKYRRSYRRCRETLCENTAVIWEARGGGDSTVHTKGMACRDPEQQQIHVVQNVVSGDFRGVPRWWFTSSCGLDVGRKGKCGRKLKGNERVLMATTPK